jgi:hypothetical protein
MAPRLARLKKELTLAQQEALLRDRYPEGRPFLSRGALIWVGKVRPTGWSATYELLIDHRPPHHPLVYVVRPRLEARAGERLPHVYSLNTLCLYLGEEWDGAHPLTDLVGWASEWCFFYEVWLATGKWQGGGLHPHEVVMNRATRRRVARGRDSKGETAAKRERLVEALQRAYGKSAVYEEFLYNTAV